MSQINSTDMNLLEAMIDRTSLSDVIAAIGAICIGKADHLLSNWQDKDHAAIYEYCAKICNRAARDLDSPM